MDSSALFICLSVFMIWCLPVLQMKSARKKIVDQRRALILHFQLLTQAALRCICTDLLWLLFAGLSPTSPLSSSHWGNHFLFRKAHNHEVPLVLSHAML